MIVRGTAETEDDRERKRVARLYVSSLREKFRDKRISLERYRSLAQRIHKELDVDFRMLPL